MKARQFAAVVAYLIINVSGAPVSNSTSTVVEPLTEPAWGPEPPGRGTYGILLSSIITLIMCVWTVLHVDIVPGMEGRKRIFRKLGYVLIGVFSPEALLLKAIKDIVEATEVHKMLRELEDPNSEHKGVESLGMHGAFFTCMGGFALRKPGGYFKATLNPAGFIHFTREGLILPEFTTKGMITDKGKADWFAKVLVCIQGIWLIIQCAARRFSGLPVTLLELHIIVHVLCTIIMYGCWMKKPLDVCEQIIVTHDTELANLLTVHHGQPRLKELEIKYPTVTSRHDDTSTSTVHNISTTQPLVEDLSVVRKGDPTPEKVSQSIKRIYFLPLSHLTVNEQPAAQGWMYGWARQPPTRRVFTKSEFMKRGRYKNTIVVWPGDTLMIGNEISIEHSQLETEYKNNRFYIEILQQIDIQVLLSAAAGIRTGKHSRWLETPDHKRLLVDRTSLITHTGREYSNILLIGIITTFLPALYGACHMVAWNAHFPTPVERLLWRISSTLVGALPTLPIILWSSLIVMCVIMEGDISKAARKRYKVRIDTWSKQHEKRLRKKFEKLAKNSPPWLLVIFGAITVFLSIILFVLYIGYSFSLIGARLFLVVESFISLRSLPIGSFQTTPWDDYWPHF